MENYYNIFVTVPTEETDTIVDKILKEKLAVCCNIFNEVRSKYWWDGNIETAFESLLIFKTTGNNLDKFIARVKELHSYEIPEIVCVKLDKGNQEYFDWIKKYTTV